MKLSINTDFTKMPRAGSVIRAADLPAGRPVPVDVVVLPQDERHLRRRVLTLHHGDRLFVDLAEPTMLGDRDVLVLDDGRHVEILAAEEDLLEIRARNAVHLAELAWHIGNRHLAAQVEADRILIARDHVVRAMLEGLGATLADVSEPFNPLRGAYAGGHSHHHDHGHGHDHGHHHGHGHGHDHGHGGPDRYGRLPGDPHYGHDHG